jgi:hypothetical protein
MCARISSQHSCMEHTFLDAITTTQAVFDQIKGAGRRKQNYYICKTHSFIHSLVDL